MAIDLQPGSLHVWAGSYGTYIIPSEVLAKAKLRKDGWFDRRFKTANDELKKWVEEQEQRARDGH